MTKDAPSLAAGLCLGGIIVGFSEAVYQGAPKIYAALLYGSLWGGFGIAFAVLLALFSRGAPRKTSSFFARGLMLSLGVSLAVLARFIIFRDVFTEDPERALHATAIAIGTALAVVLAIAASLRMLHRWIATEPLLGPWLFGVPCVVITAFALTVAITSDERRGAPPAAATKLGGRGVILIVADALRADALGVYGAKPHRGEPGSPNLDRLAETARVFTRATAQASWTKPSVTSIFTSKIPSAHATMAKAALLPAELPTLASVLSEAEVKTAAVVTNYNLDPSYGFARGFGHYAHLAAARYLGAPQGANRLAAYNAYRLLRERFLPFEREARFFYRSGADVNREALKLLDEIGDDRFFLYLHYMESHDPFFAVTGESYARVASPRPPLAWAERMRSAYRDDVRRLDDSLGEFYEALRARGLTDTTTIIVTADHGEEFGEHGGFYHGTSLYQELVHIPLIIASPSMLRGEDERLTSHIDLAPTVLGRLSVPIPASFTGRDLLADPSAPSLVLSEEDHQGHVLEAVRTSTHKLIIANPGNPRRLKPTELYDLDRDPREQYPITDNGELLRRMAKTMKDALAAARTNAAKPKERKSDAATQAELRALGYVE